MRFSICRGGVAALGGAMILGFTVAADAPKEPTPDKDGFINLFDGKDLDG